ncbi:acyltransferase [Azospirillum rugosum]|uniref:Acetyltransferase-like isoleucine patch superfamily enzyme n=1 Tax=Azospirillum rugosum TaxID=416170 RepID=A0ABS4SVE2_9PROT|nr:acyltransferase [Azospirillum rugosum]MBP2296529.1 acetyltransferase-like isoleucine patch superfamily enzyme [Azospirillum rugosum]MDQ0530071.1 acetyltransferase-like isoleucine patch superfamily enzyme [Azospirillum rugosum]
MKTAALSPRRWIEARLRACLHKALNALGGRQAAPAQPTPAPERLGAPPQVLGPLRLTLGAGCRVSDRITFSGRGTGSDVPELLVGRNVDIGWETTIAVGRRVTLGDNVRIAGRALLAGYPGHPQDPDAEAQVGDIVLEDDVWLSTGVVVGAGVRIGRGTVVAAGSVVTHDLPPMVLAGGIPARVIRPLVPNPGGRLL